MGDADPTSSLCSATSILGNLKVTTVFALVPPVLFLLLPVLDTTQVFVLRLMAKIPLVPLARDHLHHRLLAGAYHSVVRR